MNPILATFVLFTLVLSGCTAPATDEAPAPPVQPRTSTAEEVVIAGTIWFPPPTGLSGASVAVPLPVDGAPGLFDARFAKRWAPGAEPLADAASVMVRLHDPEGSVVAETMLPWQGERDGHMNVTGLAQGEHMLVFTLYGASDGTALGHHVEYHGRMKTRAGVTSGQ